MEFMINSADLIIHVPEGETGYAGENWPTDKIVEGSALPLTALSISNGTLTPAFRMGLR